MTVPRPMGLVGHYVDWPGAAALSGGRILNPATDYTILATETNNLALNVYSAAGAPALAPAAALVADPPQWACTFLKYVAGGVTAAQYNGSVLTGSMSGCYTFRYRVGGAEYVSHVGSGPTPAISLAAKSRWKVFASRPEVTNVWGIDFFYDAPDVVKLIPSFPGTAVNQFLTYHLYDAPTNAAYAILLIKTLSVGPAIWKVQKVKKLTALPWAMIKLGGKFRGA